MKIDLNCDVGEGMINEHLLLPYISSCNIACGGHFGDEKSIDKTIQLAIKNNVLIGAHPSFPDPINFGRKIMDVTKEELHKSIQSQLDLFLERMSKFNQKLHHIKPHGALYNLIAVDENAAINFIKSIKKYTKDVFLYVPYASAVERIAVQNDINIKYEAFADRNYNNDVTLVARSNENAIIADAEEVLNHICSIVFNKTVKTIFKVDKKIKADTFCIHGDHDNTLKILKFLSKQLSKKGIEIG
ncbi:5-oxoprolinase subunit PxpA [uncultured Polaribacter sp.]|uniref:5-oxoprolinase subunit PxpA n=1 Tax=uncultured Polaribacter sp. TaxID=174711 RepID=UPI0026275A03|nr:5-oxoprolinase subunit PxpA [uncultured Polaribacter sp.]